MSVFLLGPLGSMSALEGVQPEVSLSSSRRVEEFETNDGSTFVRASAKAPRTWGLSLAPWSTPEANRVALAAASGEMAGDLWLLSLAAARANVLHAHQTCGQDRLARTLLVDGIPRRSLTPGPAYTYTIDVQADALAQVASSQPLTWYGQQPASQVSSVWSTLARFTLPEAPDGAVLASVALVGVAYLPVVATTSVRRTAGAWRESVVTYSTAPTLTGTVLGTIPATASGAVFTAALGLTSADLGTQVDLAITGSSSTVGSIIGRTSPFPARRPVLRLTFTVTPATRETVVRVPVRGGQPCTLVAYTDATASQAILATFAFDYAPGSEDYLITPSAGSGVRRCATTFTPAQDTVLTVVVPASTTWLTSGLRLFEGEDDGRAFIPGRGAWARVRVYDPDQNLQLAEDGTLDRSDYTVTVREVGTPGEV